MCWHRVIGRDKIGARRAGRLPIPVPLWSARAKRWYRAADFLALRYGRMGCGMNCLTCLVAASSAYLAIIQSCKPCLLRADSISKRLRHILYMHICILRIRSIAYSFVVSPSPTLRGFCFVGWMGRQTVTFLFGSGCASGNIVAHVNLVGCRVHVIYYTGSATPVYRLEWK